VSGTTYTVSNGRVTVEQRPDYHDAFGNHRPDWIAFITGDRRRWERGLTPDEAVDKMRVSYPEAFS
jgi:hypothetical protein